MGAPTEEFGPYLVYEQLGLGGMATVHRAATRGIAGFSKQVALKRMLPSVAADANLVRSFIREAQLASQLHHANIAQTYDLGKVGETYFIAMELVRGRTVRDLVKRCASTGDPMPIPIVLNIACQVCDALDYAHNLCDESGRPLGLIHRDVSPSNIIVGEAGVVKLIDFGIAKASDSSGMGTMSGTIKGKFSYLAPEYLMGDLDARGDLFALGIVMHELLANRPLFQGKDDMDTLYRVKDMKVLPPSRFNPDVPRELDAIVMTALERDPNARWQRANAIRHALTMESKHLGLLAHNGEVFEWVRSRFDVDTSPQISVGPSTDELASLDGQSTEIAPDDWRPDVEDPTRLVRKSAPVAAQSSDLYDTQPERRAAKPASGVLARITPVPRAIPRDEPRVGETTTPPPMRGVLREIARDAARTTPVPHLNAASRPRAPVLAEDDDLDGVTTLHSDDPLDATTDAEDDDQRETLRPRSEPRPESTGGLPPAAFVRTLPGAGGYVSMAPSPAPAPPPVTQRGSAVAMPLQAPNRPSTPGPLAPGSFPVTARPVAVPTTGARTLPHMSKRDVARVATEDRSVVATTVGRRRSRSSYMLAVFVAIVAAIAAGVVYFALPYLT